MSYKMGVKAPLYTTTGISVKIEQCLKETSAAVSKVPMARLTRRVSMTSPVAEMSAT